MDDVEVRASPMLPVADRTGLGTTLPSDEPWGVREAPTSTRTSTCSASAPR